MCWGRAASRYGNCQRLRGHQVPVGEGLHHVVGRDGRAHDLSPGDRGSAFQAKAERFARRPRWDRQRHADVVLAGRHQAAAPSRIPPGTSFKERAISPSNPSLRRAKTVTGSVRRRLRIDGGRHHAELEIGPRRADPQAVGIFRAALVLGVAQAQEVGPVGGQRDMDQESAWCVIKRARLVFVVVVEGQSLARGVGQFEHGIQRRIKPAGSDFRDDLLAGAAFEAEHVPVARTIDPAVDDHRKRHRLRGFRRVVRLLFEAFRQRVDRKGHRIRDRASPLRTEKRIDSRILSLVSRSACPPAGSSPAARRWFARRPGRPAERCW